MSSPEVGANVGHLFLIVIYNQKQGNILLKKDNQPSSLSSYPFGTTPSKTKRLRLNRTSHNLIA
jgi:hypothetical protein